MLKPFDCLAFDCLAFDCLAFDCLAFAFGGSMRRRTNYIIIILFFLLLCVRIGRAENENVFDSWKGEVIKRVNLREYPEMDGKIITVLEKGDIVKVQFKHGSWYQIVSKKERSGYEGWVYGKYLSRVYDIEENQAQPKEISIKEDLQPKEIFVKEDPQPKEVSIKEDILIKGETKENTIKESTIAESNKKVILPAKEEKPIHADELDESMPLIGKTSINQEGKKNDSSFRSNSDFKSNSGENKKYSEKYSEKYSLIPELFKLTLRLLTVVLSCIAILFSFKALKIAKENRDKVMQLHKYVQKD